MTALTQALSEALLHFLWQGALVAFVLSVGLLGLRRSRPNVRYALACGAMMVLAVLPVLTAAYLYEPARTADVGVARRVVNTPAAVAEIPPAGVEADSSWMVRVREWALPLWVMGVLLSGIRLAWGAGQLSILRRDTMPASETLKSLVATIAARLGAGPVHVVVSRICEVPSTIGWLRPLLLLPASAITGLSPQQLEAVLAHELAHIRRQDYLVNIFQMVVESLLFYHPAVWWVSSVIRHERELCCDDVAVRSCGDVLCYARALTALEKLRMPRARLAMGASNGSLLYRVRRIVANEAREQGSSRVAGAMALLTLGALCLAFTIGALGQAPATPDAATPPTVVPQPEPERLTASAVMRQDVQEAPVPQPGNSDAPVAATPNADDASAWVLFRGDRIVSMQGSSADEAEAKAARQKTPDLQWGADLLWFRVDGKSYVSQDPAILARIEQAAGESSIARAPTPLPGNEAELAAYLEALASRNRATQEKADQLAAEQRVAEQIQQAGQLEGRAISELIKARQQKADQLAVEQRLAEQIQRAGQLEGRAITELIEAEMRMKTPAQIPLTEQSMAELQRQFDAVRLQLERLNEQLAGVRTSQEVLRVQQQREMERLMTDQRRMQELQQDLQTSLTSLLESLRNAVKSGTAKPVQ